jgi:hypothetical protein
MAAWSFYPMCDDIETIMQELRAKGVAYDGAVTDKRWGRVTRIVLPSGARLGLYEPRHTSPVLSCGRRGLGAALWRPLSMHTPADRPDGFSRNHASGVPSCRASIVRSCVNRSRKVHRFQEANSAPVGGFGGCGSGRRP